MSKKKLLYGVGINDYDGLVKIAGKNIASYDCWRHMLSRCYDPKSLAKHPTYAGCTVCHEWLTFSNFKRWYDTNYREGFHLDKDIIVEGNRLYSPEMCVFVPQGINTLVSKFNKDNVNIYELTPERRIGRTVTTYMAQVCSPVSGTRKNITKTFKSKFDAEDWYWSIKTEIVKWHITNALLNNKIDNRVANRILEMFIRSKPDHII